MPMSPRLLRPVAASGFDPRSIAGLEGWWDAADANSVTLDGGRVATWADKSGLGRNATNSSSGSTQPDYVTGARNGRNAIRFVAASSQRLSVPSSTATFNFLHNGTPSYIAVAVSLGTEASPNAFYGLIGNTEGGLTQRGFIVGFDNRSSQSAAKRLWFTASNGSVLVVQSNSAANDNFWETQSTVVFEALLDVGNATAASRLSARRDGLAALASNAASATPSTANAANSLFFGAAVAAVNPSLFLQGDICEILMYSQHPAAGAQTAIRRYLARKWGVTLA